MTQLGFACCSSTQQKAEAARQHKVAGARCGSSSLAAALRVTQRVALKMDDPSRVVKAKPRCVAVPDTQAVNASPCARPCHRHPHTSASCPDRPCAKMWVSAAQETRMMTADTGDPASVSMCRHKPSSAQQCVAPRHRILGVGWLLLSCCYPVPRHLLDHTRNRPSHSQDTSHL